MNTQDGPNGGGTVNPVAGAIDVTALPFNQFIGLTRTADASAPLGLPADPRYTNHLGTVHAAALIALAEATSGEYLMQAFPNLPFPVIPVVRRMEVKFRKPARGAIRGSHKVEPGTAAEFLAALLAKKRALIEVPVEVHDEQGTLALSATAEWFVAAAGAH